MSDKKLTFKEKSSIKFCEQSDPPFLKQIKEKMGYRPPTIDDKVSHFYNLNAFSLIIF